MQGRSARQLHATSYTLQATSYKLLTAHYSLQVDQRAIYKLIFLDRRAQALCGAGADGVLRFWNVKSYGECVWEQHAGHAPGEAVVALATDAANKLLFSGDSAGFVKVWGIANFVNVGGVEQSNNVKELHHWRAHEKAVASLDFIERKNLLLSASLDSQAYIRIYVPATLGLAHRSLQPCVVEVCSPTCSPWQPPVSLPRLARLAGQAVACQPRGWSTRRGAGTGTAQRLARPARRGLRAGRAGASSWREEAPTPLLELADEARRRGRRGRGRRRRRCWH